MNKLKILVLTVMAAAMVAIGALAAAPSASASGLYGTGFGKIPNPHTSVKPPPDPPDCHWVHGRPGQMIQYCERSNQ
jgi:hypothetical protein